MKKYLFSIIFLLVSYVGFSQKGLSYQAVVLDPTAIEIPGQDISGQPLVNGDVWMKFSIYNGSTLQFEEVQKTKTDGYGLVNLMIGSVSSASFNALVWDASQKTLQVYVSFNQGASYTKVSDQKLTYSPYTLFAETAGKLGGVLAISGGGTGATTAADARANLGLDQVNNTSDAAKPISTATQNALNLKANAVDVTAALAAKADTGVIKSYVDTKLATGNFASNQSSTATITDADASTKGKIQLAGDLAGTADAPTVPGLALKANTVDVNTALALKANTTDVTVALAAKADTAYVLTKVAAATIADADANTKGKIQLAGDLAGTAAAPTIPALALKANAADLVTLTSVVTSNTASITANSTAITTEATTARAAELVLTNKVAANTASITANTNAILLKAPIASPVFTGTVAIGTTNPSAAAVLDITSTSKGLLLPRLTFAQKSAITSPEAGLILWCSDCGTNGELQVYNGTNFVNMVGANAQFALPTISATSAASAITSSALTSGGSIDSDGGAFVTARGVVWNTSTNPTVSLSTKTTDGTGIGTFSSSISGLTSGVTYYVRAYATNSVGTKYGPEITVNTAQAVATLASTTAASSIGATSATSGGNITYNGGATVTVSGLVWSTSSNPTIALTTKTSNGSASGTFTSNITGLTPGTLYYVRSYATNNVGTSYGAQTSFTTLNTPTISSTTVASSITSSSAVSGGTISADGGDAVITRGIVYGTSAGSSTYSVTSGSGTGTFTSNLTGLTPATTYFVRSFATNSVGTVYGTEISFNTNAIAPTVSATADAASITGSSASSGGTISSNGGATVTVSGVVWSTTSTPTIALATKTTNGTAIGTYTSSLTGLAPATLYYVRAYATNSIGTSYGPERYFTTLAIAPTISATASATSITSSTATISGTITADGGATVTSRGVVYGTSSLSSTFSVTSGTGTGTYTIGLTGLSPATTYFVRSFATNSVGTVYGTETSFSTIAVAPSLTTTAASSITKYAASTGGTISSNGGSVITASGICWSTTATPTTSDSKTTDGTTSGTFTSSINGLTMGTTYYARAYATNAIGTSYGAVQSFTTIATAVQTAVLIGTQVWTDKNLNVANYRNGDPITFAANATQWAAANTAGEGAYTYLKFASGDGGATYGKLYNWYAVNDTRGLAPTGYHIPTQAEWTTLRGTQPGNGTTLKSSTTDWWGTFNNVNNNIVVTINPSYSSYNGNNSTGFNALPGGSQFNTGSNGNFGTASFWTSTPDATNAANAQWTYFHITFLYDGSVCCGTTDKGTGMSIRLVKDNNIIETASTTPTLSTTTSATSISANSAILGGNITDEGATQVSVRGLVYGTTTGASTYSVTLGSGGGTFTSTLTGLAQGTTYFVRSFATNVQGTSYGAETSFTTQTTPTVSVTATPSSITTTSAIGGGTISSTGGATITTSGLVWDDNANPTIALATKTTDGTASGTFTSSITGLTQGATYHLRAYATNYLGTSYGPDVTFTTVTTPTVSATATVTSITGTTATSGGTITVDGGASVTSRGIVWGTTTGSSTYSVTSGTGTGTFASNLTGLSIATTYFVRAFATNSAGTVYGPEVQFSTPSTATVASTITSTITSSTAILGGVLSSTGGATTIIGIRYSTDINFGTFSTTSINANAVAGTYTTTISGLAELTTFYVQAYATNTAGTTFGPIISFTTKEAPKTLGQFYGGGVIFYILRSGDAGYDANVQHGLIVALEDQSTGIRWNNGTNLSISTVNSIGSGSSNTNAIITSQGASSTYAAGLARAYRGGGYSDWYLGSDREMLKLSGSWDGQGYGSGIALYTLAYGVTTFQAFGSNTYWTSSQADQSLAIRQNIGSPSQYYNSKSDTHAVRAIRSF